MTDPSGTVDPDDRAAFYCPVCGYDLRGIDSPRCPECGYGLDSARSTEPQIPWVQRRGRGWIRAFWATVWWSCRHPRLILEELGRPVRERHARRFRTMVLLHVYAAAAILACAAWVADGTPGLTVEDTLQFALLACYVAIAAALAVGAPAYLFRRKNRPELLQARAALLSYYTSAPLAALPITLGGSMACHALAYVTSSNTLETLMILLGLGTFLLALWLPLLWMFRLAILARGTLRLDGWALSRWFLYLLGAWIIGAIIPALVLAGLCYVVVVVLSLTL